MTESALRIRHPLYNESRITFHEHESCITETNPCLTLINITHLVIDMDGVLYRGNDPVRGLSEFIGFLRAWPIPFRMATNNGPHADAVRRQARQARRLGCAGGDHHLGHGDGPHHGAAAPEPARVDVFGENSLRDAMTEQGFVLADEDVAAVVASIDWGVTYDKIKRACLRFVAAPVSMPPISIRRGRPRKGWCPAPAP